MNIFEMQKEERNTTLKALEKINKSLEELKELEKKLKNENLSLEEKNKILTNKLEKLDIGEISKQIEYNIYRLEGEYSRLKATVDNFKRQMEEETRVAISKYRGMVKNSLYGVLIASVLFLFLISYGYFTNIRYIKGQVEEMVVKNNLLANRINQIHWIIAEDNKFWYDKENKELYLEDNEWLRDYKKKIKNNKNIKK